MSGARLILWPVPRAGPPVPTLLLASLPGHEVWSIGESWMGTRTLSGELTGEGLSRYSLQFCSAWQGLTLPHRPLQVCTDAGEGVRADCGERSYDQGPGWLHPWPQQVCALGKGLRPQQVGGSQGNPTQSPSLEWVELPGVWDRTSPEKWLRPSLHPPGLSWCALAVA